MSQAPYRCVSCGRLRARTPSRRCADCSRMAIDTSGPRVDGGVVGTPTPEELGLPLGTGYGDHTDVPELDVLGGGSYDGGAPFVADVMPEASPAPEAGDGFGGGGGFDGGGSSDSF